MFDRDRPRPIWEYYKWLKHTVLYQIGFNYVHGPNNKSWWAGWAPPDPFLKVSASWPTNFVFFFPDQTLHRISRHRQHGWHPDLSRHLVSISAKPLSCQLYKKIDHLQQVHFKNGLDFFQSAIIEMWFVMPTSGRVHRRLLTPSSLAVLSTCSQSCWS
jgi:hypothetical protein